MARYLEGFKNKKGNIVWDGLTFIVILLVVGIVWVTAALSLDEINTDMQSEPDLSTEAKAHISDYNSSFTDTYDNLFLFAFVLLVIFLIISVFMINSHPIFLVISIILLIAVFVVAGFAANAYDDFASEDDIAPYANQFTFTSWIMRHLIEVMIGIVFIMAIVLFAKTKIS